MAASQPRRFTFRCAYQQCAKKLASIWPVPHTMQLELHCYHCNYVTLVTHDENGSFATILDKPARAVQES